MIVFSALLVCLFVRPTAGFLLDDNSVSDLLAALRQEKQARAILEAEIQNLRDDLQFIDTKQQGCKQLTSIMSPTVFMKCCTMYKGHCLI